MVLVAAAAMAGSRLAPAPSLESVATGTPATSAPLIAAPSAGPPVASPSLTSASAAPPPPTLVPPPPSLEPTAFPPVTLHVPILAYHVVAPLDVAASDLSKLLTVLPERFEDHLHALRREGWQTVTAGVLADALEHGRLLPPRTFVITLDDGHDDGWTYALPIIQRYGFVATFYIVTGLVGLPTYLTWAQLRALQALGMEIGNHTIDHLALPSQPAAEVLRQVAGAQAIFEGHLELAPTTFSYPYGLYDATTVQAVLATGLLGAMTSSGGLEQTWAARFALPRINVRNAWTGAQLIRSVNRFR